MKRIYSWVMGRRKGLCLQILFIASTYAVSYHIPFHPYIYAAQKDIKKEDIAAEVNSVPISRKELSDLVSATIPRITGHRTLPEERMTFFKTQALNQLIGQELLYQQAKKEKVKVKKAEIEEELKKIKNRYPDEKAFNEDIKRKGLTADEIKKGLERYLLITKIMKTKEKEIDEKVVINDEDLLPYYEKNKDKFILPEQIRIRQIMISVDPGAGDQEWKEAEKRAGEISGKAIKGEDFVKLAREFSDDKETRENGGDVGLMHKGQMPMPEIEEFAFSLKAGDISQPVRTIYGYLVIKVEEKRPQKLLQFSELNKDLLKTELSDSIKRSQREEWLKGLKEKADIKIYEK
jgi:parvulin-like peptidyl-prolyl isomerase